MLLLFFTVSLILGRLIRYEGCLVFQTITLMKYEGRFYEDLVHNATF